MVRETRHLWVGNLPETVREDRIRDHFKRSTEDVSPPNFEQRGTTYYDRNSRLVSETEQYIRRPNNYHTGDIRGRARDRLYRNGPYSSIIDRTPPVGHHRVPSWYDTSPSGTSTVSGGQAASPASRSVYGNVASAVVQPDTSSYDCQLIKKKKSRSGSESPCGGSGSINAASSHSSHLVDRGNGGSAASSRSHSRSPSSCSSTNSTSSNSHASSPVSGSDPPLSSSSSRTRNLQSAVSAPSQSGGLSINNQSSSTNTGSSSSSSTGNPVVHSEDNRPLAICVRNLPARSSDTSLKDGLFHEYKKHGKVTWVKVVGQNAERYALVCFKKPDDVEKALEVSHDKLFFGCKIEVAPYQGYDVEDNEFRPYEAELDEYHPKSTRTLFIGNLEKDITGSELRKHFDCFGEIIEIDIKKQGMNAYAFCQYSDIVSVVKAMRKMDGEHLGNNRIKLGFGKSMPTNCVWIDGIADSVSENHLMVQFSRYGSVSQVVIDRERKLALVSFDQIQYAQTAVKEMRGATLRGRKLQVDFASRECQEAFYEKLEKQSSGNGSNSTEISNSSVATETATANRVVSSVPGARFSRYDSTQTRSRASSFSRHTSVNSSGNTSPNTAPAVGGVTGVGSVVASTAVTATPAIPPAGGTTPRGGRSRSLRHGDYEYPERRFRSYDEYSQGSGASHDDETYTNYASTRDQRSDSPQSRLGPIPGSTVDTLEVSNTNSGRRRCDKSPGDIRNLQKERFHLLEQLEECPSSGDELVSPKKRMKFDHTSHHHNHHHTISGLQSQQQQPQQPQQQQSHPVDGSNSSNNSNSIHQTNLSIGDSNCDVLNNHSNESGASLHHRKCVEVRRLSECSSLKYATTQLPSSRRPSTESGSMISGNALRHGNHEHNMTTTTVYAAPHSVSCKRRRTSNVPGTSTISGNSTETSEYHTSRGRGHQLHSHHSHEASGGESADGSRPGTPLCDERPEVLPSEPRRIPRDKPHEPMMLPLPKFGIQFFQQNRTTAPPAAGAPSSSSSLHAGQMYSVSSSSTNININNSSSNNLLNSSSSSTLLNSSSSHSSLSNTLSSPPLLAGTRLSSSFHHPTQQMASHHHLTLHPSQPSHHQPQSVHHHHHHHHHSQSQQQQQHHHHHPTPSGGSSSLLGGIEQPPASPIRARSLSSNSSDSDMAPVSTSPSLEERIKWLDEKFEIWSGGGNVAGRPHSLSSESTQHSSSFSSRHKFLDLDVNEVKPSEIVKSVLAKKSIFDDDLQRLKNISDKYEPGDFSNLSRSSLISSTSPGIPNLAATKTPVVGGTSTTKPSSQSTVFTSPGVNQLQRLNSSPMNSPQAMSPYNSPSPSPVVASASVKVSLSQQNLVTPQPAKGLQYPFPSHPPVVTPPSTVIQPTVTTASGSSTPSATQPVTSAPQTQSKTVTETISASRPKTSTISKSFSVPGEKTSSSSGSSLSSTQGASTQSSSGRVLCKSASIPGSTNVGTVKSATSTGTSSLPTNYSNATSTKFDEDSEATGSEHNFRRSSADSSSSKSAYQKSTTTNTSKKGDKAHKHNHRNDSDRKLNKNEKSRSESIDKRKSSHSEDTPEVNDLHAKDEDRIEEDRKKKEQEDKENAERERQERLNKERQERERAEKEKQKQEKERLERERREKERRREREEREEKERKEREERERKEREERERREREERDRKEREERERREREERERKEREERERKEREEQERREREKEEQERRDKEERDRREREERERREREEAERKDREERERKERERKDIEERTKREREQKEESERLRREEETRQEEARQKELSERLRLDEKETSPASASSNKHNRDDHDHEKPSGRDRKDDEHTHFSHSHHNTNKDDKHNKENSENLFNDDTQNLRDVKVPGNSPIRMNKRRLSSQDSVDNDEQTKRMRISGENRKLFDRKEGKDSNRSKHHKSHGRASSLSKNPDDKQTSQDERYRKDSGFEEKKNKDKEHKKYDRSDKSSASAQKYKKQHSSTKDDKETTTNLARDEEMSPSETLPMFDTPEIRSTDDDDHQAQEHQHQQRHKTKKEHKEKKRHDQDDDSSTHRQSQHNNRNDSKRHDNNRHSDRKGSTRSEEGSRQTSEKSRSKPMPRKLTQSSNDSDSDEPKKHSIFDILDDGPYISMYDKVKARSCKNMQKQEEEKKIKAKFTQLKQSRAKREEKKRSTSYDGDSDSDFDDRHTKYKSSYKLNRSSGFINSSSDEGTVMRQRDSIISDSDSDARRAQYNRARLNELCDGDSSDGSILNHSKPPCKKISSKRNSRSTRIASDSSDNEVPLPRMEIEDREKLDNMEMKFKAEIKKENEERELQIEKKSETFPTVKIEKIKIEPSENLSPIKMEVKAEIKDSITDFYSTQHEDSDNNACSGSAVESKDSIFDQLFSPESRKKHKKSKKRQKSSPILADNETSIEKFDDTPTEKLTPTSLEQVFDELKRESMMSTTVPCSTSNVQFSSEKKKHKDRKEKKREKTREEYDKSAVSKEERHRLKKSKKSSKNEVNRYSFNLKRSGEKMEDIFGPISDDESQMSGSEPIQKDTAPTHLFDTPVHTQQPVVSAAINPYKQEPLTPKSHTVEENEENKQKASSHLERERHRKEKREKKRKEREKSREQHALAALQQKNDDENSVDLDEAGRALEAQLMEDSDNKLTEETTPSTATTHKSDMTDVFRFSDGDENSMEVIQHEKKETQEPHKTKEKKKKKKRSKEERHQRREHHHHSSHNNSLMSPPPSTGKLSIEITSESEGPKPTLCKPSPSLPCLLDDDSSPPLNKSSSDLNLSISPMTREKTIISPIPKTPTLSTPKSVECKKKPDKFIPGFDVELDDKISESAVKSISAEFTSPIIDPVPEEPKIPIESPPDSKVIDKIEEKSRVIISQEETEDAVAALLGESFGTSSAADYSFTDDPCDVHVEEDLSAQVPVEPVIPEEDAEEMRKAVQSLSNEEIEIKADTPQSEHDLQIDTDTEEPEEDVNNQVRFDNPPKTPDVQLPQAKQTPASKAPKVDLVASESVKVKEAPVENKKVETADSPNTTSVITKNLEVTSPTKEKVTKETKPEAKPVEKPKELEPKVEPQKPDVTPSVPATPSPEVSTAPIITTPQIVTTPPSSRPQMVYSASQQRPSQQIPPQAPIQGATQVKLPISRPQTHYVMQPPTISIPEQTHFVYPPINVMVSPRSTNEQRMQSPRLQQPQPQGGQQPSQSPQFVNVRVQSPHSPSMHRSQPTVMRSQSQLSPVLPQHVVLQQRQLMSPPGSVSTQPGPNTITSTNSPNIILNRMPVTSVLAPISKPIQPQNIILPQPNTAQTSIANKADSPHTQHPESKEIKVTGQTLTYQSTRVSTPTPSSASSPVHIGPQNQQTSLQISSPKLTHAPAAIIQQQQAMQSPIKSIGESPTPNHMAHGQPAHLQHIIPVQVQPHKGQPHQTVVLQQQQIQQQGKQHLPQPPQRMTQQMQQMSKLAQHQQQLMQHQHQIMQQRQQQMQMQQQQQHQQQHQQQKQLQQQLHQQQIHQQQHAQQQHAQIVHMQKVQQQKQQQQQHQQQHQQMQQQQHQQMQQQQHVQGQHRVVHQQVLQIHQYPQAQSGGKDSPHKGVTSPPSIIQTIPHKDAQSSPVHSRIQQNVVIVRQQPGGGVVQQPGIAQQQSAVVQQQPRTLETQQQQSIVHHTPPAQQQQILQKIPQPVPQQQQPPQVQPPQPSVQQQPQPQLVTQSQLPPQTQFQQQPPIQQISVPLPSQQVSGQQIMQLNIGVQHQKQVATSPVQSLPPQPTIPKNSLKPNVEVSQVNKSPQTKVQIVPQPQQQQPTVLAAHPKPVTEPVVIPIKPPTPVVEIESKPVEEPRGKTPQPVEETPKVVAVPETKPLAPIKTPEPEKPVEPKVEPKEPEVEPEPVARQETSAKLEPTKEVKETKPSVEQESVSVIKTQAVPTIPAEPTEKSMLTEENVTKLSPPEDEIEQDSKEDSDYWSAKELNIESVIKKVDALCSNDEIDEPMPEKAQPKEVEKEQPPEKDSSNPSANASLESVPEAEVKSDTPAESTAETEKSEDTHDEEEFEDTQSESADNGKTTRAGKRGRISRNAKKVIVNQQTSISSPTPASGVVEGVQTRRGKMSQNARGRRGRGAASKVPNTIPTVGEKKMRSHTSDQDIYEFHSDSGEESTTVKTTERPRLILTIKSPGQAVVQTRPVEKQPESTASPSPAPHPIADNTTPPQKESKEEFSTPTVNTRKSRRLQEKDGGNRSTVDDVIEDVVRNSLNSPKAGGQTPPRRSTRNSQNASTTGRAPQPVVNEKQIGPISDIRKSPRANRRTKDRKSSDASADSSDEKVLKVEEKLKPQSVEPEEERKVEKIEDVSNTKSPAAPPVKPTISVETTVTVTEKVEKPVLSTNPTEPSEPLTLIDPVTGVLTVVRQSKEGQYVPVPGAAAPLLAVPPTGKVELVQKTVPVAISEVVPVPISKVVKEEQKVPTPKAPSPSVISSETSKPSTSTTVTLPKPTSVVVSTQATPPTTSTPTTIVSPSQPQSQPLPQPPPQPPNIPQLPVQQPQQTIRTHPLKAHMLSSQVNKPVVTQGLVKVSGGVIGQAAPVVVNSPTLIKQPGTIVQTSVARNIQHNVPTTLQQCLPQTTSSAAQQSAQPHHNLIVNIPPSSSPHGAQVGPPHSPRIQQNVVVKAQQQMPQQQPTPSQQILHVVTKPGGQQQIIAQQQPQPQHQSLVIHGNKIQQVPSGYAAVVQGGKIIQQAPSPVTIQTAGKRQTIQVPLAHVQPQQHSHVQKQAGGVSVVTHQVAKRGPTPPTQPHQQHHMPQHQPSQQHMPNAMAAKQAQPGLQLASGQAAMVPGSQHIIAHAHQSSHPHQPTGATLLQAKPAHQQQVIPPTKGVVGLHQAPQIMTGAVASPPLKQPHMPGQQPVVTGASSLRASVPSISPQGQSRAHMLQPGLPVPAFEANLHDIGSFNSRTQSPPPAHQQASPITPGEGSFPAGSIRGVPPRDHFIMYQYLRELGAIPSYISRSPLLPGSTEQKELSEVDESMVASPPLELRRPGSGSRTIAVPHSLQSPQDRATDSPQVAQVYVHGTRIPHPHFPDVGARYFDNVRSVPTEPPPAHRPAHSVVAPAPCTYPTQTTGPPATLTHLHPKALEREREQREREREREKERISIPGHTSMPSHGSLVPAMPAPTGRNIQVATPPHASQVPPQADSLLTLLQRYPVMWQGLLALKTDQAAVQMHFVFGNPEVARGSLPCNSDGSTPPLRIAQRMRLEQTQLEGVAKKMQCENEHCMLLALPCGRDHMDVLQQSRNLQTGFITYLQQKMAAGIVNIPVPGSEQAAYVVHIFPSCDFANENLERAAPDLKHRVAEIAHLLIVIATV